MPVSKKRKSKKTGRPVQRAEDQLSGVTFQDLINVLAYQEHYNSKPAEVDFEDPDTQAIIRAVDSTNIDNKKEHDV